MRAEQQPCCRMHRLGIQRARIPPDPAAIQRRIRPAVQDAVEIAAARRRETRVEILRRAMRGQHDHRLLPQMCVQPVAQPAGSQVLIDLQMADLAGGMHAGIGAPGGGQHHRFAGQARDRLFECLLHGRAIRLALPADIGPSIIFKGKAIPWHGAFCHTRLHCQKFVTIC